MAHVLSPIKQLPTDGESGLLQLLKLERCSEPGTGTQRATTDNLLSLSMTALCSQASFVEFNRSKEVNCEVSFNANEIFPLSKYMRERDLSQKIMSVEVRTRSFPCRRSAHEIFFHVVEVRTRSFRRTGWVVCVTSSPFRLHFPATGFSKQEK